MHACKYIGPCPRADRSKGPGNPGFPGFLDFPDFSMFFWIFRPPVPWFKAKRQHFLYYEPLRFDPHPLEFFLREQMPQNPTLPFSRFELYFSAIVPNIFFQPLGGPFQNLLTCRISVSGISSYHRHLRLAICSTGAKRLRKTAV